ncbi:uncharacterized protein IL334_007632 [Kwoniella shivajii]|uniref:sulfiredoxin n=1 Tax=Kwoniella shivajii TaxID=564305 RepID=A0ABZ1DB20_9TREE|nr:hypothetical protein IL334_007632 [Kwoniella shivajii]
MTSVAAQELSSAVIEDPATSCLPQELQPHQSPSDTATVTASQTQDDRPSSSVFSRNEEAPVHNVPMRVIQRPLPSELDENKVLTFMEEMKRGDSFTPIEIIKVKSALKVNPTGPKEAFYFAMGGCHRFEATKRLGWETIRARIIEVPAKQMRVYLGAGSPF